MPIIITPNETKPSVELTSPASPVRFSISILRFTERDRQREIVKSVTLDETLNFTFVQIINALNSSSNTWIYNTTLPNNARLSITVSSLNLIV